MWNANKETKVQVVVVVVVRDAPIALFGGEDSVSEGKDASLSRV